MTFLSKHIGQRLDAILKQRGTSKKDLAAMMGVAPTQVTRWCKSASLQVSTLNAICEKLNLTWSDFIDQAEGEQ